MNKLLQCIVLLIIFFSGNFYCTAQINLTHNLGTTPIVTDMFSCEEDEGWARVFRLSDFGIMPNEQFIIISGEIALSSSHEGARLQYGVYALEENFPDSLNSYNYTTYLGGRGIGQAPIIDGTGPPEIIQTDFNEPIIVPAGTERILVVVSKYVDFYNPASSVVTIAGTTEDTGESWYVGCNDIYYWTPTTELPTPVPDANFYINVTGHTFNIESLGPTTRLSHNLCDDIIETNIHSCTAAYLYWARAFTLAEFGISTDEEFVISSGQVGIDKTGWLAEISFNIYSIDENFPESFSEADLIGSSQYQELSPNIDRDPQIIQVDFDTPIVIPAGVERILVEVHKGIVYGDGVAFIAGSTQDNDTSWARGCVPIPEGSGYEYGDYVSTADFGRPNANFYINVTGNVHHLTNNFQMNISNICAEFLKEFSIDDGANINSVTWNFGDPVSGANNISTDPSPFHDFSADGIYTITATVTGNDGSVENLTETINVKEPPTAYGINDVYVCEDSFDTGISSSIDVSTVTEQVLGGQIDRTVTFIDGSGTTYTTLPSPFTNTVRYRETIKVRVAREDTPCCYSETTFEIIINTLPDIQLIDDIVSCGNTNGGYAVFDLRHLPAELIGGQSGLTVNLFDSNNTIITPSEYTNFSNLVAHEDFIRAVVTESVSGCTSESVIYLIISPTPIANPLTTLLGCDDNNDGISEYFDTSTVESQVLNGQTGMTVSYFTDSGTSLASPLPNPFTNSVPNIQTITVRVTNSVTTCYQETTLQLQTVTQPSINQPSNLYACDGGGGYAEFDTTAIEQQLIGNQTGLSIQYFDANGNTLPSPLPASFQNTEPFSQTIYVKVEDVSNTICYSETSFDVIVNPLPVVNLNEKYFICNLVTSIRLDVNPNFNSYQWLFEDGSLISSSYDVTIETEGDYTLIVGQLENGILCQNMFTFHLTRSILPVIASVNYGELGNNFIEIIASGDGDFEYSIDGFNYQDSNYFGNIQGGTYIVYVRDIEGCGEDSQEVTIIDYPPFFTPNGDTFNEHWQIKGIQKYPNAQIFIFDRYGKLLKQLSANNLGWDGTFKGKKMASNDYWFTVNLNNGKSFSGHFALKR